MAERLMTHLVAGYPTDEASFHAALGMIKGGASYLEIQFPFSDPSADGPTIQAACQHALDWGWKPERGWELVRRLRNVHPEIPIYIMAYASLVFTPGIEQFCRRAKDNLVQGLIVPDLPPGQDEGLADAARRHELDLMPVVVPSITPQRLQEVLSAGFPHLYVALRSGITGAHTTLSAQVLAFLQDLSNHGVRVFGGFGIDTRSQVEVLSPHVHAIVVGSHLVRALARISPDAHPSDYEIAARLRVEELLGRTHA
jgi:tryptophan synthase alpha chain